MPKITHALLIICFLFSFSCKKAEIVPPPNNTPDVIEVADTTSFAVLGDYGDGSSDELAVSEMVKSWNIDFIITVGDNNYSYGEMETIEENISQYYCDFIYNPDAPESYRCTGAAAMDKQNRFFPSLGNHDQSGPEDYLPYVTFFSLPGQEIYYDFEWGPVHFFTVNSGKDTDHSCCESEQAIWLKEQLALSTKPFKVVYFHHPPYSSENHGNNPDMQWPFEEWGVDAVIAGHDHNYERIKKKDNPNIVYFVNGLGGKSIRNCNVHPLDESIFTSYCYNQNFGAMKCAATDDKLTFQFFEIGDRVNPVDEYVIEK